MHLAHRVEALRRGKCWQFDAFEPEAGDSDASNFEPEEGDSDPDNFRPEEGDSNPDSFERTTIDTLPAFARSSIEASA